MKLTQRERGLLPFLPVAAILGVYAWWFHLVERPKLGDAKREYHQALATEIRHPDLMQRQKEVIDLGRDVALLEQQKADLGRQGAEMAGPTGPERHAHQAALHELLKRHHLRLIEEAPMAQRGGGKLAKSLAEALGRLGHGGEAGPNAKAPPASTVQVRSLRFIGRFEDVLAAIRELSLDQNPPGIPMTLSMSEASPHTELRSWTLLVWM
jgi:hypothetical protein